MKETLLQLVFFLFASHDLYFVLLLSCFGMQQCAVAVECFLAASYLCLTRAQIHASKWARCAWSGFVDDRVECEVLAFLIEILLLDLLELDVLLSMLLQPSLIQRERMDVMCFWCLTASSVHT